MVYACFVILKCIDWQTKKKLNIILTFLTGFQYSICTKGNAQCCPGVVDR